MSEKSFTPPPGHLARYRQIMAGRPHPLQSVDGIAAITSCRRRQVICAQGQAADYWYYVIEGAALRSVVRADGRRQIVDLLLPGDFVGFSTNEEYNSSVEAANDGTVVAGYPRRRIEFEADANPRLAREIRQIAFETLSRLQDQLLILGRITVQEKVGSFILALAERLSEGRDGSIALPLSRYDIADYLAVSVETVSRSLSDLKRRGSIKIAGPRLVKIVDRDALDEGERDGCRMLSPTMRDYKPKVDHSSRASFARTASRTASAN
jgi:CRP/FNR family nitrogen fixation transcriptional regulator